MMKHWDFSTVQKVHGNDIGNIVLEIRAIRGNQGWVVANFFKLILCPLPGVAKGEDIYTYGRNTGSSWEDSHTAQIIHFSSDFLD